MPRNGLRHAWHTLVTELKCLSGEKFVKWVARGKCGFYELEEIFSYIRFHVQGERWVEPCCVPPPVFLFGKASTRWFKD